MPQAKHNLALFWIRAVLIDTIIQWRVRFSVSVNDLWNFCLKKRSTKIHLNVAMRNNFRNCLVKRSVLKLTTLVVKHESLAEDLILCWDDLQRTISHIDPSP